MPPTKVRWVEGKRKRGREGRESVKKRGQRLLLIQCVSFLCFFQPVLHSHSHREVETKDSHWAKSGKETEFLALKDINKVFLFWRRGYSHRPRLLHVLSFAQLCSQMERMQGEGEVDLLERPSPLTDKERVMIQDSWAKVYQNCDDVGVTILVRYIFLVVLLFYV